MDFIFLGLEVIFRLGPPLASTTFGEFKTQWVCPCKSTLIISVMWSKLTWFQFFLVPTGSFFHRFTRRTQALQISPDRVSLSLARQLQFVRNGLREKNIPSRAQRVHMWLLPKTAPEVLLITLAVRETGAGGLGPADAAAVQAPVHFWLMKAKHLRGKWFKY